jgi:glycosyltransferase involved in cell wall biosynthesis
MHILLIHQFFLKDQDGGGSRWNEMSRIWTEQGHQVTVLTGTTSYMANPQDVHSGKYFAKTINRDAVRVISCPVSDTYSTGFAGRIGAYLSFVISGILAGIFYAREKYDVILITSPPLFVGLSGIFLSWWKNIPFIFEIRDLWPESAIETGMLKNKWLIWLAFRFERYIYTKAKMICVLTPAFQEMLIKKKNVPAGKVICIPNGADFSLAHRASRYFNNTTFRKEHGLDGKFVITYVGAHGIANHLIQLIDTAELLQDTNVCFLLIGNGQQKDELKKETIKRCLTNIRFVGSVSKGRVFDYILAADMGTSVLKKAEIFKTIYSNKTFDYFSCKKPVLMAIDGISRKLVEDADGGIFVEPENPVDFAEKIRFYTDNPEWVRRQGENGYAFARKHFDREILARRYLQYLVRL